MGNHEIIKCQTCEAVIAQCRCPGPHTVRYVDESLCPKLHGPYCCCEKRPGGFLEVDDMESMIHKTCGRKVGPMPPVAPKAEMEYESVMVKMAYALRTAMRLLEKWERIGGKATTPMNEIRAALKAYEEIS